MDVRIDGEEVTAPIAEITSPDFHWSVNPVPAYRLPENYPGGIDVTYSNFLATLLDEYFDVYQFVKVVVEPCGGETKTFYTNPPNFRIEGITTGPVEVTFYYELIPEVIDDTDTGETDTGPDGNGAGEDTETPGDPVSDTDPAPEDNDGSATDGEVDGSEVDSGSDEDGSDSDIGGVDSGSSGGCFLNTLEWPDR